MDRPLSMFDAEFLKGGPGSGHHGHKGIPGHRGGSAPKGGTALAEPVSNVKAPKVFTKADVLEPRHNTIKQHFESLGFKWVEISTDEGFGEDMASAIGSLNSASAAFTDIVNRGLPVPNELYFRHDPYRPMIAAFEVGPTGNTILYVNSGNQSWNGSEYTGPKSKFDSGWLSSPNPNHFINHEMGHFLHYKLNPARYILLADAYFAYQGWPGHYEDTGLLPRISDAQRTEMIAKMYTLRENKNLPVTYSFNSSTAKNLIQKDVSKYAATSPLDFVAEVYSGLVHGKKFHPFIMGYYKKLGGVNPDTYIKKGGPGSGHHGHKGIPGHRGGSMPKDGATASPPQAEPAFTPKVYASKTFTVDDVRNSARDMMPIGQGNSGPIQKHFLELGFKKVEASPNATDMFRQDTVLAANYVSKTIANLRNEGLAVPDIIRFVAYGMFSPTMAAFSIETNGETFMEINVSHPSWDNKARPDDQRFLDGWHASPREGSAIEHEFGHFYHYTNAPTRYVNLALESVRRNNPERMGETEAYRSLSPTFSKEMQDKLIRFQYGSGAHFSFYDDQTQDYIKNKVSKYAAKNPSEFAAEVYAGLRYGRKFDDVILRYYKKLGGPPVKKATFGDTSGLEKADYKRLPMMAAVEVGKGGKGSGHFGHAGRPGQLGGSQAHGSVDLKTLSREHKALRARRLVQGFTINPFNAREVFAQVGTRTGAVIVKPGLPGYDVHMENLRALTRGGGRAVMQEIINRADRFGIQLDLIAEPLEPGGGKGKKLTKDKLISWYESFGFQREQPGSDYLIRKPKPKIAKGGPGSGHHGHKGIPGHRGGSMPKDGGTAVAEKPVERAVVQPKKFDLDSTYAEMTAHFKQLGFKRVLYNDTSGSSYLEYGVEADNDQRKIGNNIDLRPEARGKVADIASRASEAFAKLAKDGLPMPDALLLSHDAYNYEKYGVFDISKKGETYIFLNTGARDTTDALLQYHKDGWFAAGDRDSIVNHELGHFYHYLKSPVRFAMSHALKAYLKPNELPDYLREKAYSHLGFMRDLTDDPVLSESIKKNVSRYSMKSPNEFVAEVFNGMRSNKKYPDDIMKYYKKLGGPFVEDFKITKGGPGSGHHGHKGIPGHRGGSMPKDGGGTAVLEPPTTSAPPTPEPAPVQGRGFSSRTFTGHEPDQEIEAHFKTFGFREVLFDPALRHVPKERMKHALDAASKAFSELKNAGYDVPVTMKIDNNYYAPAAFVTKRSDNTQHWIALHLGHDFWNEDVETTMKGSAARGWIAAYHPAYPLVHEIGHFQHYKNAPVRYQTMIETDFRYNPNDPIQVKLKQMDRNIKNFYGKKVSGYAKSGGFAEFVAEVWTGKYLGKTYDPKIMKYYKALGGP